MILGRRRGRRPAGYQFLQKDFLSAPAVFRSFTHVSVRHIVAKFDIKCIFLNFFRWESIRHRQIAYLILYASSMKNFQFRPFLYDNIYFLPHLAEHIKVIFKRRIFFRNIVTKRNPRVHQPHPLYHGGGMRLLVRMRVNADRKKWHRGMREAEAKGTDPKHTPYYRNNTSENSLLFLAGWAKRTGTNGMGLKITSQDKGGSRTSKEPFSHVRQASIFPQKKSRRKKKKKVWWILTLIIDARG